MPILGAEMETGRLVEWRVRPGDRVKRGDIVAVVDTDKAAIEVEIFEDGVVEELLVEPGMRVEVGTPLARIRGAGETVPSGRAPVPSRAAGRTPAPTTAPRPEAPMRVSPAARRLAEEHHLELATVAGTGLAGAVTRGDVERALAGVTPPAALQALPEPGDRAAALRRAIAAAMTRAKREIPHYYLERSVELDPTLAWLERENARRPLSSRLLLIVLQLKAVARAVASVPEMNGHFEAGAFRPAKAVHAAVAIALKPTGLVAPALHDVDRKPLDTLMREFTDLVQRARAGMLRSSELADATITVNGLGDRGADVVHAIIHPPQVAIVGFGRTLETACVEEGRVVVRHVCRMSLAADHRVSDGHRGGLFLAAVDGLLREPEAL